MPAGPASVMQGHSGADIHDMVTHHPCNANAVVGPLLILLHTQAAVLLHSLWATAWNKTSALGIQAALMSVDDCLQHVHLLFHEQVNILCPATCPGTVHSSHYIACSKAILRPTRMHLLMS